MCGETSSRDNFMKLPYAEACEILDEIADTSSAWQSRENVPQGDPHLAKAQLQQIQGPNQVNAMEGVNLLVNKSRQHGQQMQGNQDQYEQGSSGYNWDGGYCDQSEEVLYANTYKGQQGNAPNQQWRSQGNNQIWGNQGQGNWNNNYNNSNNWGKNNQN
uniref:Uncharacterized protein n=1 Tax=Nicotiana sylvestris TaxID=4096 RepID=A0A1U7X4G9_NICSY|nr:PREDICTED: putative uncharacterized protein DDB_G0279653 [Nicotiana sylvestris]